MAKSFGEYSWFGKTLIRKAGNILGIGCQMIALGIEKLSGDRMEPIKDEDRVVGIKFRLPLSQDI